MEAYSRLLGQSITSIIEVKSESDINSFLGGEQVSFLENQITGLDDFELVCFLVVRDEEPAGTKKDGFRLVIAGGRDYRDYDRLSQEVDRYLKELHPKEKVIIVSGTAKGADRLGEEYARKKGYRLEEYPANWQHFGRAAAVKRNLEMAQLADAAIVFWDGESAGSKNMIDCATGEHIPCKVIHY